MDALLQIRQPIAAELEQYIALFDQVLVHDEPFMDQPLAHVRSRKGKMMRPILVLLLARELGEIGVSTLRSAVTLELLHTSSLVHDDVVDESNERRGVAAVHEIYSNKIAVLLGDYMLAQTLRQSALTGNLHVVEAVAQLGATLAEGEILQLSHAESEEISEATYYRIIRRKTAALFEACGTLAALSMGGDAAYLERVRRFGDKVGMCFQIRDDIFDYYDDERVGKPRGNDMREGKLTLPIIYALTHTADADALAMAQRVKQGEATSADIAHLIEFAKQHGGIDYAHRRMEELRAECLDLIADFRHTGVRTALTQYVDFVIGREL